MINRHPASHAQLVKYMRLSELKFAFLSTYEWSVFIRRTAPYGFAMSLPIGKDVSSPSLRQCFLALGVLASNDWKFVEPPEFNVAQVSFPVNNSGNLLALDPSSASRRSLHFKRPYVRPLSETKSAQGAIRHAWLVVDPLRGRRRARNDNEHMHSEIYKAIKVLRQGCTIVIDSGMHNFLYNPATNAVTMVDFELMQACEPDTMSPDEPELFHIFGDYLRYEVG
ncbi:uncharacterized protein P174DRAFT_418853 [Aspergillus novofumigatus IBT 16806]|uniref:Uncharacterized protein n=1 Tax=Aspergillus novofumigatus (strain IBT 16806) TaxID=1392255 RepID=A0A2I1CB56_ASPN1|nr:uncharacterized protein P174DRAFT_418853 [Aspergillus novofumigatus IBT 16806]PKX94879.1 hypothetical protein P174DRAFT_418853 [Aspergillus novofumigatus IBT 16806]